MMELKSINPQIIQQKCISLLLLPQQVTTSTMAYNNSFIILLFCKLEVQSKSHQIKMKALAGLSFFVFLLGEPFS